MQFQAFYTAFRHLRPRSPCIFIVVVQIRVLDTNCLWIPTGSLRGSGVIKGRNETEALVLYRDLHPLAGRSSAECPL